MNIKIIILDTDVAPLWDPTRRIFVAMMTISDYVQALQVCRKQGVSMLDLSTRTITGNAPYCTVRTL